MAYIQEYKNQATHILQICNQISSSKRILMKMKNQLITTNLKKTKASTRVGAAWPCREKKETQISQI